MCDTGKKSSGLSFFIKTDLRRYSKQASFEDFIKCYFLHHTFKYIFWMRLTGWARKNILLRPIHYLFRLILLRLKIKFGIDIPYNTKIGEGFYIGHLGGIVINHKAIIGKNCNISTGVVIGETFGGERRGVPEIGDYVYIAPGAKIIGKVSIGNNVAVGANAVVTESIPENSVVVGIPGKVISQKGSDNYIKKIV